MSWLFSQALLAEVSADISLDGAPCALWNGTPTQRPSWLPAKTTGASRLSRSMMTFKPLTDAHGEAVLTSFLEAFPVRTYPPPVKEPASTASVPECGPTWPVSSAKYDPDSRSWKTHQCSLFGGLEEFSGTWPRWGIMRDGELFPLPTPVLRTSASESGYWPTPTASTGGPEPEGKTDRKLATVVAAAMIPTPGSAKANNDTILTCSGDGRQKPNKLGWAVAAAMIPTPRAEDSQSCGAHRGTPDTLTSFVKLFPEPAYPEEYKRRMVPTRKGDQMRWETSEEYWSRQPPPEKTEVRWPTPTASMLTTADQEQARFAGNKGSNRPSYGEAKINSQPQPPIPAGNPANAATTSGATYTDATPENATALQSTNGETLTRIPTPSANDWKGSSQPGQRRGQLTDPAMGVIQAGGSLNPTWVEWLMGWPLGWTDCAASATDKFRQWSASHGISSEAR